MKKAFKRKSSTGSRNPLFLQWLAEWKDDAARKELRSQYTFAKAIRSLEKYPLTVYSGKDCKLLEGFGDKLCQSLESRLQKYLEELGTNQTAVEVINEHRDALNLLSDRGRRAPGAPSVKKPKRTPSLGAVSTQTVHARTVSSENKEYVPRPGTGAYALLITLSTHETENGQTDGLCKKELMRMAQPLAEKSFIVPDPGSRYTAWSSMGTLIKKQLVNKLSNPAKYSLTEAGRILTNHLQDEKSSSSISLSHSPKGSNVPIHNYHEIDENFNVHSNELEKSCMVGRSNSGTSLSDVINQSNLWGSSSESQTMCTDIIPVYQNNDDGVNGSIEDSSRFTKIIERRLLFSYLSDEDVEHHFKDKAGVTVDDELGIGFLIKAKYDDLLTCGLRYKLDFSRLSGDDFVHAYLHDSDAPDVAPGLHSFNSSSSHSGDKVKRLDNNVKSSLSVSSHSAMKSSDNFKLPSTSSKSNTILNDQADGVSSLTNGNKCVKEKTKVRSAPETKNISAKVTKTSEVSAASSSAMNLCPRQLASRIDSSSKADDLGEVGNENINLGQPDIVLPPGSFDIILCVDNHEIKTGSKLLNQDQMIRELNKNSVMYEIRPLQVGDFLWIAKSRIGTGSCNLAANRSDVRAELVLEHIIERKRMDDLASSIMDGRYREQKHRMRGCGLKYPTYLVEMYGSIQNFTISEDSLSQAIINSRVIDEFFVKRTRDTKESAEYLCMMTRHLQRFYSRKTLHGFNKHFKWSQCPSASNSSEAYLMAYDVFNASSMKTRPLTVMETFAKNLMQINGITAEKAGAIVKQFATPAILVDAYKNCTSDKSRHDLLSDLKFGSNKRSLGPNLSKTIALMYWTSDKHA